MTMTDHPNAGNTLDVVLLSPDTPAIEPAFSEIRFFAPERSQS